MEYGISIVGWGYGIMKGGDLCVLDPADQPFVTSSSKMELVEVHITVFLLSLI